MEHVGCHRAKLRTRERDGRGDRFGEHLGERFVTRRVVCAGGKARKKWSLRFFFATGCEGGTRER